MCQHVAFKQLGGITLVVTADQTVSVVHAGTVDCKPAESFQKPLNQTEHFTKSANQGGITLVVIADQTVSVVHAGTVDWKPAENFQKPLNQTESFTRSANQQKLQQCNL